MLMRLMPRPVRERLCLFFADLSNRCAGGSVCEPVVYRRGYQISVITHNFLRVKLTGPQARRLALKILGLTDGPTDDDPPAVPMPLVPPQPMFPMSPRFQPSSN